MFNPGAGVTVPLVERNVLVSEPNTPTFASAAKLSPTGSKPTASRNSPITRMSALRAPVVGADTLFVIWNSPSQAKPASTAR